MDTLKKVVECGANVLMDHPSLAMMISETIYTQLTATEIHPLIDGKSDKYKDRTSYDKLCNLRKQVNVLLSYDTEIPPEWRLNTEHCPQHAFTHKKSIEYIDRMETILLEINSPQTTSVIAILARLKQIFNSIEDRNIKHKSNLSFKDRWKYFREDGFEAMFFMDFTTWVCSRLAHYKIDNQTTIQILNIWITYCTEVKNTVLLNRFSGKIRKFKDPRSYLEHIISDLEHIKENIIKRIEAESFNDKLTHIMESYKTLNNKTLTFLYLLLPEASNTTLIITDLMSPATHQTEDPKIKELKSTLTGSWLIKTLELTGIKTNDFNMDKEFDVNVIESYLQEDLSKLETNDFTKSGLWPFSHRKQYEVASGFPLVTPYSNTIYFELHDGGSLKYQVLSPRQEIKEGIILKESLDYLDLQLTPGSKKLTEKDLMNIKANLHGILDITSTQGHTFSYNTTTSNYLNKIILIHRKLLLSINAITIILACTEVNKTYGKSWVYGDSIQHTLVEQLTYMLNESSTILIEQIDDFWNIFYLKHYSETNNYEDHSHLSFQRLILCNKIIASMHSIHEQIISTIKNINDLKRHTTNNPSNFKKCIAKLQTELSKSIPVLNRVSTSPRRKEFDYLNISQSEINPEINTQEVKKEATSKTTSETTSENSLSTEVHTTNIELEFTSLIQSIINTLNAKENFAKKCISKPDKFYTKLQEEIYNNFLIQNERFIDRARVVEWCHKLFYISNQPKFILLYTCINQAMNLIYSDSKTLPTQVADVIDILLHTNIMTAFEEYKFYSFSLKLETKPLSITLQGDSEHVITYDPFASSEAKAAKAYAIENYFLQERITKLESTVSQSNDIIANKDLEIQQQKDIVAAKETQLELTATELDETKTKLHERELELAKKESVITEKESVITEKESVIAEKESVIADIKTTLSKKNNEILELTKIISQLEENMLQNTMRTKELLKQLQDISINPSNNNEQNDAPEISESAPIPLAKEEVTTGKKSGSFLGFFSLKSKKEVSASAFISKPA